MEKEESLELALRNCRALAHKNKNAGDWARVKLFVDAAIGQPSLLRGDHQAELAQAPQLIVFGGDLYARKP